jgi:hypothetical protein
MFMLPGVGIQAFEAEVNSYEPLEVLVALDRVRGAPMAVAHGKVEDGPHEPGVRVSRLGGLVHVDLTMVSGENYARETYVIPEECFTDFATALLKVLSEG